MKGLLAAVTAILVAGTVAGTAEAKSCRGSQWVGAWAASPSDGAGRPFAEQTLRMNVTPLFGGSTLRFRLSNRFGRQTVTFDSVYVGKQQAGAALLPGTNRRVRFRGRRKVRIRAGDEVTSDRVRLPFSAFERLAVSLYIRTDTGNVTEHFQAAQTSYLTPPGSGDHAGEESAGAFTQATSSRFFVTGVDVRASTRTSAVVTFGDSITAGYRARPNFTRDPAIPAGFDQAVRYPDFLARRLAAQASRYSVLNAGISGNQILRGAPSPSGLRALSRFRDDVRHLSGATDVIVLEGINDLGAAPSASSKDVIDGLRQLVGGLERLTSRSPRRRRLNVLVGTLLPSGGTPLFEYGTELTNARRQRINQFIRTSRIGSGVVDFDAALRDPADPSRLNPIYDSGDHVHPSPAGLEAMAGAVPLRRLRGSGC